LAKIVFSDKLLGAKYSRRLNAKVGRIKGGTME
jgi:hypothetical protein